MTLLSLAVGLVGVILGGVALYTLHGHRRRIKALEEPEWEWTPMGFDLSGTLEYPDPPDEDEPLDDEWYEVPWEI